MQEHIRKSHWGAYNWNSSFMNSNGQAVIRNCPFYIYGTITSVSIKLTTGYDGYICKLFIVNANSLNILFVSNPITTGNGIAQCNDINLNVDTPLLVGIVFANSNIRIAGYQEPENGDSTVMWSGKGDTSSYYNQVATGNQFSGNLYWSSRYLGLSITYTTEEQTVESVTLDSQFNAGIIYSNYNSVEIDPAITGDSIGYFVGYLDNLILGKRLSNNHASMKLDQLILSERSPTNTDGLSTKLDQLILSERSPTNTDGLSTKLDQLILLEKISTESNGLSADEISLGDSLRNHDATNVDPVLVDSNAQSKFDLSVTPTRQYKNQIVTVHCERKNHKSLNGKYQFSIGEEIIIPYAQSNEDITFIDFEISADNLETGNNTCRLNYSYADGGQEYIDFEVFKETPLRQEVIRTFKHYDGGYIGDRINAAPNSLSVSPCFLVPDGQDSTIIYTTAKTAVPLDKYAGILGVNIDAAGARIYVSFDGRSTWKSYIIDAWEDVLIDDIEEQGMTPEFLNSLMQDQWSGVFAQTQLDFAISLNNLLSPYVDDAWLRVQTGGASVNKGVVSNTYYPDEGFVIYKVTNIVAAKGSGSRGWVYAVYETGNVQLAYGGSGNVGSITYTENNYPIAILAGASSTYGYYGGYSSFTMYTRKLTAYLKSITVLLPPNQSPAVTNIQLAPDTVHTENTILTAHIADAEGDPAYYRILVNGVPLTEYATNGTEFDISVTIPNDLLIIGTSAIDIQTYDENTYSTPYTVYVTKTNTLPTVFGILDKMDFTATVNDADGDEVRYRILINGVLVQDWSGFEDQPLNIAYTMKKANIVIDHQNTLTLEVQDSLGETAAVDFDFVGQYYGLLFKDVDGVLLSDDEGNVLKQLDFGVIMAGANSEPKKIVVSNTTGDNLRDVLVTTEGELPDNPATPQPETTIQFDNTMDFNRPVSQFPIASLNNNTESELWMRVLTGRKSLSGGPVNLRAKGEVK